jgi:hypothetical protein
MPLGPRGGIGEGPDKASRKVDDPTGVPAPPPVDRVPNETNQRTFGVEAQSSGSNLFDTPAQAFGIVVDIIDPDPVFDKPPILLRAKKPRSESDGVKVLIEGVVRVGEVVPNPR